MGIYIKGMEMPTCCCVCPCFNDEYCYCQAADKDLGSIPIDHRHPDCPLVPVPPHGDLIDREYAIATACSGRIRALPTTEDGENWIRVNEVRESIKSAPTVIPADNQGGDAK